MGNGRRSGKSSGMSSEKSLEQSSGESSGNSRRRGRALAGAVAVLGVGCMLLGVSARHSGQNAPVQAAGLTMSAALSTSAPNPKPDLHSVLGGLPVIFEPNQGQAPASVRFLAHGAGYGLFLDSTGAVMAVPTASTGSGQSTASLRMKLVDPNLHAAITGTDPLPGHTNYFLGNEPSKWHSNIPQFAGVRYEKIYPGIDLTFYSNHGSLEYDFHVAPGADPSRAEMEFEGAARLALNHGDLILDRGADGRVLFRAPHIYQRLGDREQVVPGGFTLLTATRAGFAIGDYDHSRELIIDPRPEIESYFGGNGTETSPSIAVDFSGTSIFLAGSTTSTPTSFPLGGLPPTQIGPGANVFVAQILPGSVRFITFLGGSGGPGADTATGVAVDGSGRSYLVGNTTSTDFPTTSSAYLTAPRTKTISCTGTCSSLFVTVLDPNGSSSPIYSSYISGNGNDVSTGMAVDLNSNVFITGTTTSQDPASISDVFPAGQAPPAQQNAYQPHPEAALQFFVTKVNTASSGPSSIAYSTYFGGGTPSNAIAVGGGIAVDSTGNIYFSGTTNFSFANIGRPPDFPILNAYQPCLNQPPATMTNPIQCPAPTLNTDAFVAKINPNTAGQQLLFSTYLGGANNDSSTALALDNPGGSAANIFITGTTNSTDFVVPTGTAAFQGTNTCGTCAYVGRFANATTGVAGLTYFTYLGGTAADGVTNGLAVAVDTANGALLTGSTTSPTLPVTPGALQSMLDGPQDAFFARIDTTTTSGQTGVGSFLTYFGGNGTDRGTSITSDLNTNTYFAGDTNSNSGLPLDVPLQSTLNGAQNDFYAKLGTAADLSMTSVSPTVGTCPPGGACSVDAGTTVTIKYVLLNSGPDLATGIKITGLASSSNVVFKSASVDSGTCTTEVSNGGLTCQVNTLQPGGIAHVTFSVEPNAPGNYQVSATVSSTFPTDQNPDNDTASAPFQANSFTLSATPNSQAVNAGDKATYTVILSPTSAAGYNTAITVSASGAPSATGTTFGSASITPGLTPVSTSLTLSTTQRAVPVANATRHGRTFYAFWVFLPGLALFGAGKKRRRRMLCALSLLALFAVMLLQPACKGSTQTTLVSGTPAGTFPITITATSGSVTHSTTVNLTVN